MASERRATHSAIAADATRERSSYLQGGGRWWKVVEGGGRGWKVTEGLGSGQGVVARGEGRGAREVQVCFDEL